MSKEGDGVKFIFHCQWEIVEDRRKHHTVLLQYYNCLLTGPVNVGDSLIGKNSISCFLALLSYQSCLTLSLNVDLNPGWISLKKQLVPSKTNK